MFEVKQSITVAAPIEACAAFLAIPENLVTIDRKVRHMQTLPSKTGYRLVLSGRFAGFLPYKLGLDLCFKSDGGFTASGKSGILKKFSTAFDLKKYSGGTLVSHVESYEFYGEFLARRFFHSEVRNVVDEELRRFKIFVEQGWETKVTWDV